MIEDIWDTTVARARALPEPSLSAMDEVKETIAAVTPAELERVCVPRRRRATRTSRTRFSKCLHVIRKKEWEHHGYAVRDLGLLDGRSG